MKTRLRNARAVLVLMFWAGPVLGGQKYAATYFGGSANDSAWGIALDKAGSVFVVGSTSSPDFMTAERSVLTSPRGKSDVYILKFDKDLKTILASARIGGSEDECAYAILHDKRGFVYVSGYTASKDFPTTPGAFSSKYNGGEGDAFILKMDDNLSKIVASTFLGGSGTEDDWFSPAMGLDQNGNIYVAGITSSVDFPTTDQAYAKIFHGGANDVFLSKFDPELNHLLASTLIGGSARDNLGRSLRIDPKSDEIFIAGFTSSPDFPTTPEAYFRTIKGDTGNGFIAKFDLQLSRLTSSTILPDALIGCLLIHANGDIYVGGHGGKTLPTTSSAYYRFFDKHYDQGFISRFSHDLTELKSSTVLPGSFFYGGGGVNALNLAQSPEGNIVAAGWSGPKDFPTTPGAFDETHNGGSDSIIYKMNEDLSELLASTFIGGSNNERWNRLVTDESGRIYLAGYTLSTDFPTTPGSAAEKFKGGPTDGFVVRIAQNLSSEVFEEFHDAAKRNRLDQLKRLLASDGARLEKKDKYQRTALHAAARHGASAAAEYLISQGANIQATDESGNTPLHLASMYGHDNIVEDLIRKKADLNVTNIEGATPLILASIYGPPRTVGLLLAQGVDVRPMDHSGFTALHYAASYGYPEKAKEILKAGSDIDAKNGAGKTPLHLAFETPRNDEVIRLLLEGGASLSAKDNAGKNALHYATRFFVAVEFFKEILQKEGNINVQDQNGDTPLHAILAEAIQMKSVSPVRKEKVILLLDQGADPKIKNKNGKSPLDLALEVGDKSMIDLLKALKRSA